MTTTASRSTGSLPLVSLTYSTVMLGGTLPIPLWQIFAARLGFGPFMVTMAFGSYAVGTIASLTVLSTWSDHVGRRPALLTGLALSAANAVLLLVAPDAGVVLLARLVGGVGAGITAAAASAALAELAPGDRAGRAGTLATISNVGGLGSGVLVAAVALQLGGARPLTVDVLFLGYLVLLVGLAAALAVVPETVPARRRGGLTWQRPLLPEGQQARRVFGWAALGVSVAFAVTGLFSSLVPGFLRDDLGIHVPVVPGLVVALLFVAALAGQTLVPRSLVHRPWVGPAGLALGTGLYEAGLLVGGLGLFVAGTTVAGVGFGLTFRRGMDVVQRVAGSGGRADQLATWFLCAYAGNVLPTLALGAARQEWGVPIASAGIAVLIVLGASAAGLGASRSGRRTAGGRRGSAPLPTPLADARATPVRWSASRRDRR